MLFQIPMPDPGSTAAPPSWTLFDFVAAGALIFFAGLMIDLALRKFGKNRAVAVVGIVLVFMWLWAELAVGIFTNWGS